MKMRTLGRTGWQVSEAGIGGEHLEKVDRETVIKVIDECDRCGMNIIDIFMSNPSVRTDLGIALKGRRERFIIQGHIGAAWDGAQYFRTRDAKICREAFSDLLNLLQTDYIDIGMIHYIDEVEDYNAAMNGDVLKLAREYLANGVIRCIGLSTHNPTVARMAAESGHIDVIMFSLNPAYDMLPASENVDALYAGESYSDAAMSGINADRDMLYRVCEANGVALTVMKGYGGGMLLTAENSPFETALSPVQCIHYALTRPGVASILVGYMTEEHVRAAHAYESAAERERDYASVLAAAPKHAYIGKCTYCGHCAPCPVRIDVAMVNKYLDLATLYDDVPATVAGHYGLLAAHAGDCIACEACEGRCPFGVKVTERMERAREVFGK